MFRRLVTQHTRALFTRQPHPQTLYLRCLTTKTVNLDKEIETITDLATTAKDEMDFAEESRNSVYYNEDKKAAQAAVEEMTQTYNDLLASLNDSDKKQIHSRIGMKIKEIQSAYEIMTLNDLED